MGGGDYTQEEYLHMRSIVSSGGGWIPHISPQTEVSCLVEKILRIEKERDALSGLHMVGWREMCDGAQETLTF